MKSLRNIALALTLSVSTIGTIALAPVALAADHGMVKHSGDLVKKRKTLKGSYEIVQREGARYVVFSDDFKAAKGPDLKIFLSPTNIAQVDGKTAINGSINLGELQKTTGAQEYRIPDDVDLANFSSVLVHCEQYSVLWGGADL